MTSTSTDPLRTAAAVVDPPPGRRVSWAGIFAGTVVALGLMVFFTTLGIAIGFGAVDPAEEADPLAGLATGTGIYVVVTQLISLAVGGFTAARLGTIHRAIAAALHGASVWALATLLLAIAAISGAGSLFGAAASLVQTTGSAVSSAVSTLVPEDFEFPSLPDVAGQITLDDLPEEVRQVLGDANVSTARLQREAREALGAVVSEQERQRAMNIVSGALQDALQNPGQIGSEVSDAIDSLVGGENAVFSEEDREEVAAQLERRLGIEPEEVREVLAAVERRIEATIEDLRQTLDQIQQRALEIAERVTSTVSTAAWLLTIASLLGLLAACGAAFAGRTREPVVAARR